jgi:hypothetical protein
MSSGRRDRPALNERRPSGLRRPHRALRARGFSPVPSAKMRIAVVVLQDARQGYIMTVEGILHASAAEAFCIAPSPAARATTPRHGQLAGVLDAHASAVLAQLEEAP